MAQPAEGLRGALKRSRGLVIATNLARHAWLSVAGRLRPRRAVRLGARHEGFDLEQSIDYVDWVVGDYERYGGLGEEALSVARVLELGPGDNLGVALRLLGSGAARVVSLDRFVTWRDPAQQRRVNAALVERMEPRQRERVAGLFAADGEIAPDQDRLVLIEGTGIEDAEAVLPAASFEALVSRAVLAHVYDLDRAYTAMDRLLAPGGTMAHKIDLSDMGAFTDGGHNPLTFLTIPDPVWDRMRRHTGHSNRMMAGFHRRRLAELGYEVEVLVTRIIGGEELPAPIGLDQVGDRLEGGPQALIDEIRPKLVDRYRQLNDDELAVADIFLRARKPA